MKIRIKKRGVLGVKRISLDGKIGRLEQKEGLQIYFRSLEGVGVLAFGPKEVELLKRKVFAREGEKKITKRSAVKKRKVKQ